MQSCLDAEDSGDKDSSQAFTVIDPDRGAKGLHKGNGNEDMNEGTDLKVISELSLDNMHDEAGEEVGESIHLGRRLLFFAVDQGLSWATRICKGKQGHLVYHREATRSPGWHLTGDSYSGSTQIGQRNA